MEQLTATNLAGASEKAIDMSRGETKYSAVTLSRGTYYIEDSVPFVRVWEELIAEYQNGELIVQDPDNNEGERKEYERLNEEARKTGRIY